VLKFLIFIFSRNGKLSRRHFQTVARRKYVVVSLLLMLLRSQRNTKVLQLTKNLCSTKKLILMRGPTLRMINMILRYVFTYFFFCSIH